MAHARSNAKRAVRYVALHAEKNVVKHHVEFHAVAPCMEVASDNIQAEAIPLFLDRQTLFHWNDKKTLT